MPIFFVHCVGIECRHNHLLSACRQSAAGRHHYSRYNELRVYLFAEEKKGDFMVNREYLFEVGGKGKNFEQIKDEPNSFLAVDDIEIDQFNRIPLWMFGFLY